MKVGVVSGHIGCVAVTAIVVACGSTEGGADSDLGWRGQDLVVSPTAATSAPNARVQRQREVEEYQRQRSEGWVIVDTRETPSGQVVDYVLAETLYPDAPEAPFATPPPEERLDDTIGPDGKAVLHAATESQLEDALWPPSGTIPVLREQFLEYVENGDEYDDLNDFIAHLDDPANMTAKGKLYGYHGANVPNQELQGVINLWNYGEVNFSNELSLMQLAQGAYHPSTGALNDTIEVGFVRNRPSQGDYNVTVREWTH